MKFTNRFQEVKNDVKSFIDSIKEFFKNNSRYKQPEFPKSPDLSSSPPLTDIKKEQEEVEVIETAIPEAKEPSIMPIWNEESDLENMQEDMRKSQTAFGIVPDWRGITRDNDKDDWYLTSYYENPLKDMRFKTQEEAETFLNAFACNCAAYSMRTDCDKNRSEIPTKRKLKIIDGKISFVIDGKEHDWLSAEQTRQYISEQIKKNDTNNEFGINVDLPFCGQTISGRIFSLLFGKDYASLNENDMKSLEKYTETSGLMNDILWANIGNLDNHSVRVHHVDYYDTESNKNIFSKLTTIESAIDDIIKINNSMQPLKNDIRLYRRVLMKHFNGKIPLSPDEAIGSKLDLNGFSSTSAVKASTEGFGYTYDEKLDFVLDIPKGTPAHWIGLMPEFSNYSYEINEVLLPPCNCTIQSINKSKDGKVVVLADPQKLDINSLILKSLHRIKEHNTQSPEVALKIDYMINKVRNINLQTNNLLDR